MAAQTMAVRRLLKDLKEVKECPLVNVVGEPEEGNLFVWHVNIRSSEDDEMAEASNPFSRAVFHLILQFPSSFPTDGPNVYLCTPLPHPNVALQQPSQVILISTYTLRSHATRMPVNFSSPIYMVIVNRYGFTLFTFLQTIDNSLMQKWKQQHVHP
jgi:hypothetical protein